jgi:hypothetical protein
MKWVLSILLGLFLVAWFLNYRLLTNIHDITSCMGQYYFWVDREKIYKFMMLFLAGVCFIQGSGVVKAFSCFIVIIISGDLIDKLFFGITGYVLADILLIVLALVASVIVYRNERRFKLDRDASKLVN